MLTADRRTRTVRFSNGTAASRANPDDTHTSTAHCSHDIDHTDTPPDDPDIATADDTTVTGDCDVITDDCNIVTGDANSPPLALQSH